MTICHYCKADGARTRELSRETREGETLFLMALVDEPPPNTFPAITSDKRRLRFVLCYDCVHRAMVHVSRKPPACFDDMLIAATYGAFTCDTILIGGRPPGGWPRIFDGPDMHGSARLSREMGWAT